MEILKEYDVEPEYIEIELMETMDYREYAIMSDLYQELKKRGITMGICKIFLHRCRIRKSAS